MNNKPLVSIITPCYNMRKYIYRLLESVLKQTYKNIELIIVDDGSTDNLKNIIDEYEKKFKSIGMRLVYIYQENSGQAEAINKGLQAMTGKYFTWIDSDDFLKETSVARRVQELENAGLGHFCITEYDCVNEKNVAQVKLVGRRDKPEGKDEFFTDLIKCKNVVFAGGVMVRRGDWLKVCPDNQLYVSREGQNWQLMLPITYYLKCIYIEEPLYVVVEHEDSHSRVKRTLEENIQRCMNFMELLEKTIKKMGIEDERKYIELVNEKQLRDIIYYCLQEKNNGLFCEFYQLYKEKYGILECVSIRKQQMKYKITRNRFLRKILGKNPL